MVQSTGCVGSVARCVENIVWHTQCGAGCGKYSHKLFLNPRLPAATQQSACRELPPDTQVDSQRVDTGQRTVNKRTVDGGIPVRGQSTGGQSTVGHRSADSQQEDSQRVDSGQSPDGQ